VEELKSLDKLTQPDDRMRYFVGYTLEYFRGRAAAIKISASAPENVHNKARLLDYEPFKA
jgi:hypothetical protein